MVNGSTAAFEALVSITLHAEGSVLSFGSIPRAHPSGSPGATISHPPPADSNNNGQRHTSVR